MYTYICMYIYIYIYTYICVYICKYTDVFTYLYMYMIGQDGKRSTHRLLEQDDGFFYKKL